MNCTLKPAEQEDLLLRHIAGESLPAYQHHLTTCAHCRELVDLHSALNDWAAPPVSTDFDQRLWARIHAGAQHTHPWYVRWFRFDLGWRLALPAALAACLLGGYLLLPRATEPQEIIRAEEIESAERTLEDLEALQALHSPAEDPGSPATPRESL